MYITRLTKINNNYYVIGTSHDHTVHGHTNINAQVGSHLAVWYEDDGWMHIAVDGADLGPLLPQVTKVCVVFESMHN